MDRPLELLLRHLDANRDGLWAAVDSVPVALHLRRPEPGRWSVADVLEHLVLLERRVGALFAQQLSAIPRRRGDAPEIADVDVLIDTRRLLDRSRPITTGDALRPHGTLDPTTARDALTQSRRVLRDAVSSADGLALETVSLPHPAFGPLNLYQWIAFMGTHEARHAAQIREIGAQLRHVAG
jgi:uncharacterized damage-inducible protein DinB